MCGANMFTFINLRLQEIKKCSRPFGGVNIITIGDLFQLHPVMDNWVFHLPSTDYNNLAPHPWLDNMELFELTQIMRHSGDKRFAEALNNMREGKHTDEDVQLISQRVVQSSDCKYPLDATHILYYNPTVASHNSLLLNSCQSEKISHPSVDIVIGDIPEEVKKQILEKAPTRAGDSMGLSKVYSTGIGLRNEMTLNLDVQDGLINGAGGITKGFSYTPSTTASVSIATILCQNCSSMSRRYLITDSSSDPK